jgi:transcriptional antiterminator NusG
MKNNEFKWYSVRCATGKEEQAIQNINFSLEFNNLSQYVEDIICPKEKQYYLRKEKKVTRNKVMLPGYILIKMIPVGEVPRTIESTNLVSGIMGNSKGPEPLKDREVERIFGNIEKSKNEVEFLRGEEVNIIDGPFKTFKGIVKDANKEKNKIKLDVTIFGTLTPLELNYLQVEKIS